MPVAAVVATAELVQGYGDGYIQNLRDWNLIVDNLVKPTFDGALALPDLAGAVAELSTERALAATGSSP